MLKTTTKKKKKLNKEKIDELINAEEDYWKGNQMLW